MTEPRPPDVLVVGAGPTGLALALQAHAHGARVRIVERRPEPFRPSRALILHARTLEVLRPLGVVPPICARADTTPEVRLHLGARELPVRLAGLDLPDTAFPHLTLVRQADVEAVLARALTDRGVTVERGTELVEARDGAGSARAVLRSRGGTEHLRCRFVAGCDGAASTVRQQAALGWQGAPYAEEVLLADLELDAAAGTWQNGCAHVVVGRRGLVFLFPLGERATWRLLATQRAGDHPAAFGRPGPPVPADELRGVLAAAGLPAAVREVAWSERIRLQHRLAARFRSGRLFLAGDAAHTHSPAAGQGMNAGLQDAANLGWKLAFAAGGEGDAPLLDSYERERRPTARKVLALTHVAFWAEASTAPAPSLLRGTLAPLGAPVVPLLMRRRRLLAEGVRLLSQFRFGYPGSPISAEGTPRVHAGTPPGHRLPDRTVVVGGRFRRLHELLATPGVHVLLQRDARPVEHLALGGQVAFHRLGSVPGTGMTAVRPDGYVGLRAGTADPDQLRAWLGRIGLAAPAGGAVGRARPQAR